MTREEVNDEIYDLTYQREISEQEIYKLTHKMLDDFENRICNNCKYWIDDNGYQNAGCIKFSINFSDTFGCNKFERKN